MWTLRHLAAALALMDQPNITAEEIVRKAMNIAGNLCVYTNHSLTIEKIESVPVNSNTTTTTSNDSSKENGNTIEQTI